MPEEQDHVLTNRRLSRYRIGERLGIGGTGEVHKAEDLELGRPVALKFPSRGQINDSGSRERLLQEARAAATLNHPNIATIHEVGLDDERPFIAMEYVEGGTL